MSGVPVEDFFSHRTFENTASNTPQGLAQYTAAQGGIEGNDDHDEVKEKEPKPLKIRHLAARSGMRRNLTEAPYFTKTERTGFAGYLAKY